MRRLLKTITLALVIVGMFVASTTTAIATNKTQETLLLGDADRDGRVSIIDVTAIQSHLARLKYLSEDGLLTSDVDCDGDIDIQDATSIQKYLAKYNCKYPVGEPLKEQDNIPVVPELNEYAPIDSDTTDMLTSEMLWKIEKKFYELVNEERTSKGLNPLTYDKHLDEIAQIRSKEVTELFSHTRPNGESFSSIIDLDKYPYMLTGENISYFHHLQGSFKPADIVFTGSDEQLENAARITFEGFKNSPGHYANMMHEGFENAGIGISYVWQDDLGIPRFYLSHNFGTRFN